MKKLLVIVGIIPLLTKAGDIIGRKGFQLIFAPQAEPGFLNTQRPASRNVWGGFSGVGSITGQALNFKADPLFLSIMQAVGDLPANFNWSGEKDANGNYVTPKELQRLIGSKVEGEICTEMCEPYIIEGSVSADKRRINYTCVVLNGEQKASVFSAQGHNIVTDPVRKQELEILGSQIANTNAVARESRRESRFAGVSQESLVNSKIGG